MTLEIIYHLFLRAMWSTARSSVKLIFSPLNMESRPASTLRDLAKLMRRSKTSWLILFLEKSSKISPSSGVFRHWLKGNEVHII